MSFGLEHIHVRGFRSARDVVLEPGAICALVGDANAGKSNLLAAVHALLDPVAAPIRPDDPSRGGDGQVTIEGRTAAGASLSISSGPEGATEITGGQRPAVLVLPADLRAEHLMAPVENGSPPLHRAARIIEVALAEQNGTHDAHAESAPALALVEAFASLCAARIHGLTVLIEEPELYLRPQAQRYLHRLLREFALAGNQVLYSTHAPTFLNVARLDELALVDHHTKIGTRVRQPDPVTGGEDFRALSEFDAERSELFLARSVILVEGLTEKLALPFMFRALGHDADREAISIVECGGKGNMLVFIRICKAAQVPFVVIHDRDTRGQRVLNAQIKAEAGQDRTIELRPDFEGVTGLPGGKHKPEQAWRRFSAPDARIPEPLAHAIALALKAARS